MGWKKILKKFIFEHKVSTSFQEQKTVGWSNSYPRCLTGGEVSRLLRRPAHLDRLCFPVLHRSHVALTTHRLQCFLGNYLGFLGGSCNTLAVFPMTHPASPPAWAPTKPAVSMSSTWPKQITRIWMHISPFKERFSGNHINLKWNRHKNIRIAAYTKPSTLHS